MGSERTDSIDRDADIARRIAAGDAGAEEEFARLYQPGLAVLARVRCGVSRADDLVQETLAAALKNLRRGEWSGSGPLAAYLAAILRHLLLRARASEGNPGPATDPETLPAAGDGPAEEAERRERRTRLLAAVASLPPRHRDVILMHYLEDETVEAIARRLGVPRGTVLSRLYHARIKIGLALNRRAVGRHRSS